MTIDIISKLKPKNNGSFPICEDINIEGGYQSRIDITDRNNIPLLNRKIGMLVYLQSDKKFYTLKTGIDNTDWEEFTIVISDSFTAGGDLSGNETSQTIININSIPVSTNIPEDCSNLQISSELMIRNSQDITNDGYNIWIADYYGLTNDGYGGIARLHPIDNVITLRYNYDASNILGFSIDSLHLKSIVYVDGYIYALGISTINILLKILPSTGEVVNYWDIMAFELYSAGDTLWGVSDYNLATDSYLIKIDTTTLEAEIIITDIPGTRFHFTYDSISNKIWISHSNIINRLDPISALLEITNSTDYSDPNNLIVADGYLWLINSTDTIYQVNLDGVLIGTVSDIYNHLTQPDLIGFDSTNNKIYIINNSAFTPKIISVNINTLAIDGIVSLTTNNIYYSSTFLNNYIWLCSGAYISKIDLTQCSSPDKSFFNGIDKLINSNTPILEYVIKNVYKTSNVTTNKSIANNEHIIFCNDNSNIVLPQNPLNGQVHTFIATGESFNIYTDAVGGTLFTGVSSISKASITIIWFNSSWQIISAMYELL
jgi:hypothetical protein